MKKTLYLISVVFILSGLFNGCGPADAKNSVDKEPETVSEDNSSDQIREFTGEKGEFVALEDNQIVVEADSVSDGKAHYYNTTLPNGDPVYFFVVKSPDGNLRAAANGCQVCGPALQGFHQDGDSMVCNTCGNAYPLDKIATEKGGCNPAPINPDLDVENGKVTISASELEEIKQYFN